MDLAAVLMIEVLNGIAGLALISIGLAIIFGMMRVINLAHGEFMMLGAYAAIVATTHGVNIWIAMLVVAPIVVGVIGVIAERAIIRFLYGRMIDTLLATWGLSLFFIGLVTTIFGNVSAGIRAPLGSVAVGRYNISVYRLVLIGITALLLAVIFIVLRRTRLGLIARGTMENPDMAAALGVSPRRVYATTFGIGAALSGLAGGLLAPISGILPTVGAAYVAKAFITVISGGTAILAGTLAAAGLFGTVNQLLTYFTTPVIGEAGLLAAAILLLRVLPHGITGKLFRGSLFVTFRPGIVVTTAAMVAIGLGVPRVVDQFGLLQLTVFAAMCILALSLGVVWGCGGILCFGQSAFFGLGAYAYAVTAINLGESTVAVILSIVVPAVVAALLGYFMFYGRLSDVYLGVITLSVTLIFFNLMNSTAGDAYRVGRARLNGFNGMPSLPTLNMPGDPGRVLDPAETFYLVMALLVIVYVGLHALLASHFGRVVVAIRENETRCELLGYDVRLHKLLIFTIGGGIAGLAGCLFANWGAFVSPTVFSLTMTSQIIIWVIVGGLGTLLGPIIGCLIMQYLATLLGTQQLANTNLIFGIIFLAFVLLVPRGIVPSVGRLGARLFAAAPARRLEPGA